MYSLQKRTLRLFLTFILMVVVTVLIVIGLVNFNLLVSIVEKIIVAIVLLGIYVFVLRKLFGLS